MTEKITLKSLDLDAASEYFTKVASAAGGFRVGVKASSSPALIVQNLGQVFESEAGNMSMISSVFSLVELLDETGEGSEDVETSGLSETIPDVYLAALRLRALAATLVRASERLEQLVPLARDARRELDLIRTHALNRI